jgi:tyrosyl-DNA phosphodiesterase-1
MLVTSANLSKQAWGEAMNVGGDIRICSYEIGVLVWPELYGDGAVMVPTFKTDSPEKVVKSGANIVVGARMPYDTPLQPYSKEDVPWCATATYTEQDVGWLIYLNQCGCFSPMFQQLANLLNIVERRNMGE